MYVAAKWWPQLKHFTDESFTWAQAVVWLEKKQRLQSRIAFSEHVKFCLFIVVHFHSLQNCHCKIAFIWEEQHTQRIANDAWHQYKLQHNDFEFASAKNNDSWWWYGGKNVHAHHVHGKWISTRLCANGFWQSCLYFDGWQQGLCSDTMGYSRCVKYRWTRVFTAQFAIYFNLLEFIV